ncbi:hypothetical protein FRC12_024737 [Ceratobasidium sp. 428]|nr:hypothetical protein FRC12_024737 [Ceratobasidium sp. 428]
MDVLRKFLPEGLKSQVEVYRAAKSARQGLDGEEAAAEQMKTKQEDEPEVSFEPVDLDGKDVGGEREGDEDEATVEGIRARVTLDGVVDVLYHVYICIPLCPTPERQPSLALLPYANQSRPHRIVLESTYPKNKMRQYDRSYQHAANKIRLV